VIVLTEQESSAIVDEALTLKAARNAFLATARS
jgi:hypothetical protein